MLVLLPATQGIYGFMSITLRFSDSSTFAESNLAAAANPSAIAQVFSFISASAAIKTYLIKRSFPTTESAIRLKLPQRFFNG